DQPGVPMVELRTSCEGAAKVSVTQSRDLPLGSKGDGDVRWKIPMCLRLGAKGALREQCLVAEEASSAVALEGGACPEWVLPNADAAGYYRFALDAAGWKALVGARDQLNVREHLAIIDSLESGWKSGRIDTATALDALSAFVTSPDRRAMQAPMGL